MASGFFRWQLRLRWLPSAVMLLLFAAAMATEAAAQQDVGQNAKAGPISFQDGYLSVSVGNISRVDLLNRIGAVAGFKVIVVGDFRADSRSWSFSNLPLRKALKRLLADTNAIVAEASDADPAQPISTIYLLGSGSGAIRSLEVVSVEPDPNEQRQQGDDAAGAAPESIPANAEAEEIDYQAQAELVNKLQFDPSTEVRMRALNELQAMGGENLRAVLESALGDSDEAIRTQAEHLLQNLPE